MSRLDDVINALSTCSSLAEASAKLGMTGSAIRGVMRRAGLRSSSFMAGDEIPVEWSEPVEDVKPDASSAPIADRTYVEKPELVTDLRPLVTESGTERVLLIPDTHRPYHDKRAWSLVVDVARSWKPHTIVHLCDYVDCFTISDHDRDPRRLTQFKGETDDANEGLDELDAVGASRKVFCLGNHEYRLWRYLVRSAPALLDTVSVEAALRLAERGWRVVPYREHLRVGKLFVTHEVGHAGVHAVRATGIAMGGNVAFGHTHRLGVSYTGLVTGERHVSASLGWLGDAKQADYLPEAKKREWQLGFGVAHVEPCGNVHLSAVPIVDYRCVVDGVTYRG